MTKATERRAAEARLTAAREELRAAEEAYHEATYVDLHEARRRWGTGYKVVFDAEQRPTSYVDGFGREVPHEEWDEFTAYLEAKARAEWAAIDSGAWPS